MESISLEFNLRKPYDEAGLLLNAFDSIIKKGGHIEISILEDGTFLSIKVFRCINTNYATALGAKIRNKITKKASLNISKINLANSYGSKVSFELKECTDGKHGPTIIITLLKNPNESSQHLIDSQFKILDLAMKTPSN